jgi:cytochrome c oxidase assembly protein Cox11
MYIHFYLFCLDLCKEYGHRVKNQIRVIIIIIIIIIIIRLDQVFVHLRYTICKVLGTNTTHKRCTHRPKPTYEEMSQCCGIEQYTQTDRQADRQTDRQTDRQRTYSE